MGGGAGGAGDPGRHRVAGMLALRDSKNSTTRSRPFASSRADLDTPTLQLWLFRVYISSADGFGSTVHAIINEPVKTVKANRTSPLGFAKLVANATLNSTETLPPLVRAARIVGTTPDKAGDLRALFEPVCSTRLPPTGWSETIK